eukprot:UN06737
MLVNSILVSISSSLDNFTVGFLNGVRGINSTSKINFIISAANALVMLVAGLFADTIENNVPPSIGNLISSLIFFVLSYQTYNESISHNKPDTELELGEFQLMDKEKSDADLLRKQKRKKNNELLGLVIGLSFSNIDR